MFLYACVLEQYIPVAFNKLDDGMSLYNKVYNASIYTQYLPMVNPAVKTLANGRHAVDGTKFENALDHIDFPTGFQVANVQLRFTVIPVMPVIS